MNVSPIMGKLILSFFFTFLLFLISTTAWPHFQISLLYLWVYLFKFAPLPNIKSTTRTLHLRNGKIAYLFFPSRVPLRVQFPPVYLFRVSFSRLPTVPHSCLCMQDRKYNKSYFRIRKYHCTGWRLQTFAKDAVIKYTTCTRSSGDQYQMQTLCLGLFAVPGMHIQSLQVKC